MAIYQNGCWQTERNTLKNQDGTVSQTHSGLVTTNYGLLAIGISVYIWQY